MLSRQSTMFKSLRVVALLLAVVISIVHGQDDSNGNTVSSSDDSDNTIFNQPTEASTAVSTTESSVRSVLHVFDGGLLEGILNALVNSPLGLIFRPLSLILRPIFWITDTALAPVFFFVRLILTPIVGILDLMFMPVRGVSNLLDSIRHILGNPVLAIAPLLSLVISNISGILTSALGATSGQNSVQRRKRRGIMDSMMGMAWTTLTYPFNLVYGIITTLLSPFYYLYNTVTWPLHFILGGDADNDISTSIATVANYLPFSDMISALLLNLSDSSQDTIINMLKLAWVHAKEYLFPAVDELIVWAQNSEYVPEDVKTGLSSLHSTYSMLHLFGIL